MLIRGFKHPQKKENYQYKCRLKSGDYIVNPPFSCFHRYLALQNNCEQEIPT